MPTQHTLHYPIVVSHQALTSVAKMVRTLCTLTSLFKSIIEDKYTEKTLQRRSHLPNLYTLLANSQNDFLGCLDLVQVKE